MFYAFVVVILAIVQVAIICDLYHAWRRGRAYAGLTDQQLELLFALEGKYENRATLHDEAVSAESSALTIGQAYDKDELWAPYHECSRRVLELEQQCLDADIEPWRVSENVIVKLSK